MEEFWDLEEKEANPQKMGEDCWRAGLSQAGLGWCGLFVRCPGICMG